MATALSVVVSLHMTRTVSTCGCVVGIDEGSPGNGVVRSQSHRAYDWRL